MAMPEPIVDQDAQFRLLVEQVKDYGIFLLDLEGRVNSWNEGARRLKGYEAPEILGRHFSVFYPPEDVAAGKPGRELAQARAEGRVEDEGWRVRKDGQRFWANVVITALRGADGRICGYAKVTRDVGARRRLEQELRDANESLLLQNQQVEQANRAKNEFLANLSHELRTPLNSIIGFSEIIQDGKAGPVTQTQQEFLGDVLDGARHLLQLINDLLDLAKVEAGKVRLRLARLDLAELLQRAATALQPQARQRGITVALEAVPALPGIMGDPDRLQQVLQNYLSNAIKFSPQGGSVALRCRDLGTHVRLEVQDHGIGIAAEDQATLFADFVQLDAGAAKKYQGTGLGLSLCRKMMELHGGRVGVQSSPGAGSLFYADLPKAVAGTP